MASSLYTVVYLHGFNVMHWVKQSSFACQIATHRVKPLHKVRRSRRPNIYKICPYTKVYTTNANISYLARQKGPQEHYNVQRHTTISATLLDDRPWPRNRRSPLTGDTDGKLEDETVTRKRGGTTHAAPAPGASDTTAAPSRITWQ